MSRDDMPLWILALLLLVAILGSCVYHGRGGPSTADERARENY